MQCIKEAILPVHRKFVFIMFSRVAINLYILIIIILSKGGKEGTYQQLCPDFEITDFPLSLQKGCSDVADEKGNLNTFCVCFTDGLVLIPRKYHLTERLF